jgi:hypothetical protein
MSDRVGGGIWAVLCWFAAKTASALAGGTTEAQLLSGAFGGLL